MHYKTGKVVAEVWLNTGGTRRLWPGDYSNPKALSFQTSEMLFAALCEWPKRSRTLLQSVPFTNNLLVAIVFHRMYYHCYIVKHCIECYSPFPNFFFAGFHWQNLSTPLPTLSAPFRGGEGNANSWSRKKVKNILFCLIKMMQSLTSCV